MNTMIDDTKRIMLRFSPVNLESMDALLEEGMYKNRSELIRDCVRRTVLAWEYNLPVEKFDDVDAVTDRNSQVNVRFTFAELKKMDACIFNGRFSDRTDFIRHCIKRTLPEIGRMIGKEVA